METVAGQNLAGGNYKIVACGFANAQPQPYTGTLTITTSRAAPPAPPNYKRRDVLWAVQRSRLPAD